MGADLNSASYTQNGPKQAIGVVQLDASGAYAGQGSASGDPTKIALATPAITAASAYASGNVVGGLLTFADVANAEPRSGLIQDVALYCKSAQTFLFDLILFHTNPTASTFTDKAALAVAAADFNKISTVIHGSDWTSLGTPSYAQANNLAREFKLPALSTTLYGVIVSRGTPTFASTSDITAVVKTLAN